jgi:hypothetical protein
VLPGQNEETTGSQWLAISLHAMAAKECARLDGKRT